MELPRIYIETSVISYLTARPSGDLITAANQQITLVWWEQRREYFELYISKIVLDEIAVGDENAIQRRQKVVTSLPILAVDDNVATLAKALIEAAALPTKALYDAFHIAIATCNVMDYLLTWNFKHIANATMRAKIEATCRDFGYNPPIICSPQELMED